MSKINDDDVDVDGPVSEKNLRQVKLLIGYKFIALYQKLIDLYYQDISNNIKL